MRWSCGWRPTQGRQSDRALDGCLETKAIASTDDRPCLPLVQFRPWFEAWLRPKLAATRFSGDNAAVDSASEFAALASLSGGSRGGLQPDGAAHIGCDHRMRSIVVAVLQFRWHSDDKSRCHQEGVIHMLRKSQSLNDAPIFDGTTPPTCGA